MKWTAVFFLTKSAESDLERMAGVDEDVKNEVVEVIREIAESISDEKVINHMYETVLDHKDWSNAQTTYIIGKIEVKGRMIIVKLTNVKDMHTEMILKEKLEKLEETVEKITLYSNNSPCFNCAEAFIKYLDKNKNVHLTLFVTSLYIVKRKSCEEHHSDLSCFKHETSNNKKLRVLKSHVQCSIDGFRMKNWTELLDLMEISPEYKEQISEKYNKAQPDSARSRAEEDEYIRSDLRDI